MIWYDTYLAPLQQTTETKLMHAGVCKALALHPTQTNRTVGRWWIVLLLPLLVTAGCAIIVTAPTIPIQAIIVTIFIVPMHDGWSSVLWLQKFANTWIWWWCCWKFSLAIWCWWTLDCQSLCHCCFSIDSIVCNPFIKVQHKLIFSTLFGPHKMDLSSTQSHVHAAKLAEYKMYPIKVY